jgi:formylglycine-generating enzyme required for sulfatase activity
VGHYPTGASPYGVLDTSGNVWEWVNDWFAPDYYSTSPYMDPQGPPPGTYGSKVQRGGSWDYYYYGIRAAFRSADIPTERDNNVGFRCAMSAGQ